ncbi:MAG: ethanolamine utilization protein EutP [Firmicutes bacterium HGW-Firmicutes-7]|nr:MAG: ethanolamine utilization protein EutP [Firmicutes bacterium HGW-Firmicutes-7]
MKKIILMGKSTCGKTTLTQALQGKKIQYRKTQYINHYDVIIDTPGEYAENHTLARALALFAYEADVIGFLISSTEHYSLYPPCIVGQVTRPVIGIVTQIDAKEANPNQAEKWLRLVGCTDIFHVSAYTGEGVGEILEYLRDKNDVLPWDS